MRVSRATFLEACGLALLGARVGARAILFSADSIDMSAVRSNRAEGSQHDGRFRLQDATAPLFLQHVNTSFAVSSADGTRAELVLAEIIERPITKNVEQFSLVFHAPAGAAVRDGTHAFLHPALGDFNLFIVSVGASNRRRTVYQACFSHHLSSRDATEATRRSPRDASESKRRESCGSELNPREARPGDGARSAAPHWRT